MKKPSATNEADGQETRLYRAVANRIRDLIRDENMQSGRRG